MEPTRKKQFRSQAGFAAVIAGFALLLPLTLPVALGILAAALLQRPIRAFQRHAGCSYRIAAFLCTALALAAVSGTVFLLGRILLHEIAAFSQRLPFLLEALARYADLLSRHLSRVSRHLPGTIGDAFQSWLQGILSSGGALAQNLYGWMFSTVSRILTALPNILFFLLTMVLSCFFAGAEFPRLQELLTAYLPENWQRRLGQLRTHLTAALRGWISAQTRLMGVTFLVLLTGLLLLRVRAALLLAAGITVLDALPVLGTGTILIPWACTAILSGNSGLGFGLIILYGAAALLRNVLEPRFLGASLGISPLLTLAAVYAGWRLGGLGGMLLLPIGVTALSHLVLSARIPSVPSAAAFSSEKVPESH